MKLKDYLHLYIGAAVRLNTYHRKFSQYGWLTGHKFQFTACKYCEFVEEDYWDVTLFLRPLSDMTKEELREVMTICYRSVYSSEPAFDVVEMIADESGGGLKATEHPKWEYGLTVTMDGPSFSANGSFLNIPVFEVTRYLLSKGFDLFGLIDAGLALDKTKEVAYG